MTDHSAPSSGMERLLGIMKALRTPETGCPWDLEQTYDTIAPYTIEEAYEVADAIERQDFDDLKSELGDLLFQVVFYAQLASEDGRFDFEDIAQAISDKMTARHPHVFGDAKMRGSEAQTVAWEEQKAAERAKKAKSTEPVSALDDVARTLPAIVRSQKLQKRAARVGFDWPDHEPVLEKLYEEVDELRSAVGNEDRENIEEELGDILFVAVNLARKLDTSAEGALKAANAKFEKRFKLMEREAERKGVDFSSLSLDQQEALWVEVKKHEKAEM